MSETILPLHNVKQARQYALDVYDSRMPADVKRALSACINALDGVLCNAEQPEDAPPISEHEALVADGCAEQPKRDAWIKGCRYGQRSTLEYYADEIRRGTQQAFEPTCEQCGLSVSECKELDRKLRESDTKATLAGTTNRLSLLKYLSGALHLAHEERDACGWAKAEIERQRTAIDAALKDCVDNDLAGCERILRVVLGEKHDAE